MMFEDKEHGAALLPLASVAVPLPAAVAGESGGGCCATTVWVDACAERTTHICTWDAVCNSLAISREVVFAFTTVTRSCNCNWLLVN